jgi:hypothetical protein
MASSCMKTMLYEFVTRLSISHLNIAIWYYHVHRILTMHMAYFMKTNFKIEGVGQFPS